MTNDNDSKVEVEIAASSEKFELTDERWIDQVNELYKDLHHEAGSVRIEGEAEEGSKGGFETIILALGSAGAITAAVEIFKAWLSRDRGRNLKITVKSGDQTDVYEVGGVGADLGTLKEFMKEVLSRRG